MDKFDIPGLTVMALSLIMSVDVCCWLAMSWSTSSGTCCPCVLCMCMAVDSWTWTCTGYNDPSMLELIDIGLQRSPIPVELACSWGIPTTTPTWQCSQGRKVHMWQCQWPSGGRTIGWLLPKISLQAGSRQCNSGSPTKAGCGTPAEVLTLVLKAHIYGCPLPNSLADDKYDTLPLKAAHTPSLHNDRASTVLSSTCGTGNGQSPCRARSLPSVPTSGPRTSALTAAVTWPNVSTAPLPNTSRPCVLLGRAVGRTVLGFWYTMFESLWLQGLLKGGPWRAYYDAASHLCKPQVWDFVVCCHNPIVPHRGR